MATKITDDISLFHDKYQWWFGKRYTNKDGTTGFNRVTGYFRELSGAFEDLGKREARSLEGAGIPELIEALKEHEAKMRALAEDIQSALERRETTKGGNK